MPDAERDGDYYRLSPDDAERERSRGTAGERRRMVRGMGTARGTVRMLQLRERQRQREGDCRLEGRRTPRGMGLYGREILEREGRGVALEGKGNIISLQPVFKQQKENEKKKIKISQPRHLVVRLL
jgi:hypothetical protein